MKFSSKTWRILSFAVCGSTLLAVTACGYDKKEEDDPSRNRGLC